jgi:protein-disulfide isomerase
MKLALAAMTFAAISPGAVKPLIEGKADSAVRVVIWEDLQCSDCAAFRKMLDEKILPKYGGKVAFEHRDFPLPKHHWARQAAIAARYFHTVSPGLAVEWRRYAASHQGEITSENFREKLSAWAGAHGVDPAKLAAGLDDEALAAAVEADYQDGIARGIAHTPTVLVNGEPFIETFTFEEISQGIERAIGGK